MEFEKCAIIEDQKKIIKKLKNKFYPPRELYHDIEVLKIVFKRLNMDASPLNIKPSYNPYEYNLLDKRYIQTYYKYCDCFDKYYDFFLKCAESYTKLLKKNNFLEIENFNCSKKYTMKDTINLLLDFYASLGNEEYNFAKKSFREKRIFLSTGILGDEKTKGECLITKYLGSSYIFIKYDDKIDLNVMMSLVHELGHAYEVKKVLNKFHRFNTIETQHMLEISSIFYQIEFLRYLEKNKINLFETMGLINNIYEWLNIWNSQLLDTANTDMIVEKDSLFVSANKDEWFIDPNYEFSRVFRKCDENLNVTNEIYLFSTDLDDNILYGIGGYIALHFNELKKQDPKEFKKNFDKFLSMRTLMDYESILKMLELNMEEFLSGKLIEPQLIKDQESYKRQYKINI